VLTGNVLRSRHFSLSVSPYDERIATHYDVLGVPSDASFATIRTAYREQARRLHPDRLGSDDEDRMAAVNEAYRVLCEPGRRALYDRSLIAGPPTLTGTGTGQTEAGDADADEGDRRPVDVYPTSRLSNLSPPGPARVPWKLMLVAAVLGSALVLFAASFNDPPSQEPPDGILRAGSCVVVEPNGDAREVACTNTDADVIVELLLPTGATCPATLAAHRDRLGLGTACIPFD